MASDAPLDQVNAALDDFWQTLFSPSDGGGTAAQIPPLEELLPDVTDECLASFAACLRGKTEEMRRTQAELIKLDP